MLDAAEGDVGEWTECEAGALAGGDACELTKCAASARAELGCEQVIQMSEAAKNPRAAILLCCLNHICKVSFIGASHWRTKDRFVHKGATLALLTIHWARRPMN